MDSKRTATATETVCGYTRDYEETLLWFARLPDCAEIRERRCVHIA